MAKQSVIPLKSKGWLVKHWNSSKYALLFLAPWMIGFLVFSIYPIFHSLYLSFTDFNLFQAPKLIGMENYKSLMGDPRFIQSCKVTSIYVFVGVPLQLAFALLLALVLNRGIHGLKYFRAIYYLPALLGGSVAISVLWRQVFGMQGIINQFFGFLGLPDTVTSISWISNPKYALITLIILRVWQFGSPMIIFIAGLKQIPLELYESASIDGANTVRKFIYITLPMLSPIILFNLVMQIISAFQAFTPAYIIGGVSGGALDSLLFYTLYLYTIGFNYFKMGYASSIAWVLMIAISILTLFIFKFSKNTVHYES
ncbi:MAG: carbohydrate ABC transporter permease [Ruminiclostridium sp.]